MSRLYRLQSLRLTDRVSHVMLEMEHKDVVLSGETFHIKAFEAPLFWKGSYQISYRETVFVFNYYLFLV